MNIFLTLRCGHNDSAFFIQPFIDQVRIENIIVFRDTESLAFDKVKYVTNAIPLLGRLNFLLRIFQILVRNQEKPAAIFGIYEIPHGLIAVIAGKLMRKPSVVSIIGNPAYTKLRKGFRMKLTLWILRNANFVTVTGTKSKAFLISNGISESKISILPNTMDFTGFNRIAIDKKYDIISLGRISKEKRVDLIVRIVYELKKKNLNIRAAIGGTGHELSIIKQLIQNLDLEENIHLTGFVPEDKLAEFFNHGQVFVLTSETEGFPRTIIQAAACGVPVVASNVGDMTDVIDHKINGLLVENPTDINEYVGYIQYLMNNPDVVDKFAKALNQKVREDFTTKKATRVWENILRQIG